MPEDSKYDRQVKKAKKLVTFVIIPLIILSAGIIGISGYLEDQARPSFVEIISTLDIHCYNVNWFGTYGFQITYKESIEEIADALAVYNYDFKASEFFKDKEVENYLVISCPHIDSKLEAPEKFAPLIGKTAIDKCFEARMKFVDYEDYCLQFKS